MTKLTVNHLTKTDRQDIADALRVADVNGEYSVRLGVETLRCVLATVDALEKALARRLEFKASHVWDCGCADCLEHRALLAALEGK